MVESLTLSRGARARHRQAQLPSLPGYQCAASSSPPPFLSSSLRCAPAQHDIAASAPPAAPAAAAQLAPLPDLVAQVDIPYQSFKLDNGLTVLVHTDRKAPVVGVTTYYRVGSKNEPRGKTGFAHLYEHLFFGGSENVPNFDIPLEGAGSTSTNGSTWYDRTNYVETVPTGALDLALFMESDRMGHLLGAVTQDKLDKQRGVVQNEKRHGDNQPYGLTEYLIGDALFPVGHPYRHSTIGSMADLDAATLSDVRQVVHRQLRPQQRHSGAHRRHRRGNRAAAGRKMVRRHSARPRDRRADLADRHARCAEAAGHHRPGPGDARSSRCGAARA